MSQPEPTHSRSRPASVAPPDIEGSPEREQPQQNFERSRSRPARSTSPGSDSDAQSRTGHRRRRGKNRDLPSVEEEENNHQVATSARNAATRAHGGSQEVDHARGGGDDMGDKPLKLRLDLNLDVDIELKARVHGDVTLALL